MANAQSYDDEFRRTAVEVWLKEGLSQRQAAAELGISEGALREWKKRFFGDGDVPAASGGEGATLDEMAAEIRRLRKENEKLRRREEILKKAASILGEDPQTEMP
jgi:transposase